MQPSAKSSTMTFDSSELRQRLPRDPSMPQKAQSAELAQQTVSELNAAEKEAHKDESLRRTYGRTPDGTVFTVPQTHDMVSQLFSPTEPKTLSDIIVVLILGSHIALYFLLPKSFRIPAFAVIYLFWRATYNGGIGYVLWNQSNYNTLVIMAKRSRIFENPTKSSNPHPLLYKLLKRDMELQIPKDYKFETAPIEYNTWLVFRRIVDLILMCDFVSYCLFAAACGGTPDGEHVAMTISRWVAGWALVFFNLWVKLDAHRVVKDFAWYWGDFFFLIDQNLTFDGVFEMAPHPMYSVGYAGYYGISLMAASYKVLFISIIAHAAQFAFLSFVESPHIEKTYNPPQPRRSSVAQTESPDTLRPVDSYDSVAGLSTSTPSLPPLEEVNREERKELERSGRDLLGLSNIDLHRITDLSTILMQGYLYILAISTPRTWGFKALFVLHALGWRLWYSVGLGYILDQQSKYKSWTRHFIKHGESVERAWRQWKGVYHLSMTMCYSSFLVAAFKMYTLPPDWTIGMAILRHVLGFALITLQIWVDFSIYESLGEFGWFFGDFFFDRVSKLTYGGIYRFLNNPERILGLAGVWGCALITWSKAIFFLALLSHTLSLCFLQFVENPHMQKLYGRSLRGDSGVSKSIRRSLPRPLQHVQGSVDRVFGDAMETIEDFIDSVRHQLSAGVDYIVKDTRAILRHYPARVSITRIAPDMEGVDKRAYSIEFEGTISSALSSTEKASGREGEEARYTNSNDQPIMLEYGAPIKVKWRAPLNHSKRDWIGLYMVSDNPSREATLVQSFGRWVATTKGGWDWPQAEIGIVVSDQPSIEWKDDRGQPLMAGEMEFSGDKLWWTTGVFEFRYHHDAKHNVMAISEPFEVQIGKFDEEDVVIDSANSMRIAIEQALLPVVRNCFDRDPNVAPSYAEEAFGALVERDGKFARRVVFVVRQMFGIDLAPQVVKADGSVRNLAWRICNAKQVLAPYSMTPAKGMTPGLDSSTPAVTPTEEKGN